LHFKPKEPTQVVIFQRPRLGESGLFKVPIRLSLLLIAILTGCAKPLNPHVDIDKAVLVLLCEVEPNGRLYHIREVFKADRHIGGVSAGETVTLPFGDPDTARRYPVRIVFFSDTEPELMKVFAGPRWEHFVVNDRLEAYEITVEKFRIAVKNRAAKANDLTR
jgi:hypothetical protein